MLMFIHGGIAWTNSFKICFVFSFFSETAEICDKDTDCFLQNDVMRVVFAGDSISFSIAIERKKKDFEKKRGKVKEKKMMAIIVIVQSTHTYFFSFSELFNSKGTHTKGKLHRHTTIGIYIKKVKLR